MHTIQVHGSAERALIEHLAKHLAPVDVGVELPATGAKDHRPYVHVRLTGSSEVPHRCLGGTAKPWQRRSRVTIQTWGQGRDMKDQPDWLVDPCTGAPFLSDRAQANHLANAVDALILYGPQWAHCGVLICSAGQIVGPRWEPDQTCDRTRYVASYELSHLSVPVAAKKIIPELTLKTL